MSGRLAPGARLTQATVRARTGLGPAPVREALRRLQAEGLLVSHGGRIHVSRRLSANEGRLLHDCRLAIEPHLTMLAAGRGTPAALSAIRSAHESFERAPDDDPAEAARLDADFHLAIYTAAESALATVLVGYWPQLRLELADGAHRPGDTRYSLAEHSKILTAVEDQDAELAAELMRQHLFFEWERRARPAREGDASARAAAHPDARARDDSGGPLTAMWLPVHGEDADDGERRDTRRRPDAATSAGRVADQLRLAIINGSLQPGERLPAKALADRLGTSRTPIREALQRLEVEGLVELHPHRGAVVRAFDAEDIIELYELRAVLEPAAAGRAATRMSRRGLDRLAELCDLAEARADDPDAIDDHIAWNEELHRLIAEGADSPRLLAAMRNTTGIPRAFRKAFWTSETQRRHSLFCHRQLLHALEAKRPELAESVMRMHIVSAREFLAEVTGRHGPA